MKAGKQAMGGEGPTEVCGIPFRLIEGNVDLTPSKLVGHFSPGKTIALHFKQDYGVVVFDTKAGILKGINQYKSPTPMSEEVLSPDAHGYTNIGEALEIGIGEMESYPKKIGALLGLDVW